MQNNFPNHNFYGEEKIRNFRDSKYTWYVDPLDGTSNFVRNIPLFGISIGLIKNNEPILGVLYFPILNLIVYGKKGEGAFANGKKIRVSDRGTKNSLYYSGGYHNGKLRLKEKIVEKVGMVKIIDSSSYELAQIAMGDAELYILRNVPHDVIAGVAIIREAGGEVTDYEGNEYTLNSKNIVASNGKVHKEILKILKKRKY